ncbi:MAG: type II secretion system F family protein [Actinomycetota bacterium]
MRSWPGRPWSFVLAIAGCAFLGAAVGELLAGPVAALAGAAGGPFVLLSIVARRAAAEQVRAEEHLQEAILALAAATRAGLSIRRAVEEAARDAGPPLDAELARVIDRLDVGDSLESALSSLASRLELRDIGLVVTVLSLHRRTGGDLPAMLEQVAEVVGDRVRSRREVRAITAQGRASGAILAVLPVAFVALLSGTGGEALGAFYRTPLGAGLLLAGLACEALGFWWIRRIVHRAEMAP